MASPETVEIMHISPAASPGLDRWVELMTADQASKRTGSFEQQGSKIPRVPSTFRKIVKNKDCYDPSVVTIGPYHHRKKEDFEEMEKLKVSFAFQFVNSICEMIPEEVYQKVQNVASNARQYYAEGSTNEFDDDNFVQMMLLDGCFILNFVFCLHRMPENVMMGSHQAALVTKDLFLLENQLPFEVLRSIMSSSRKVQQAEVGKLLGQFCDLVRAFPPERDINIMDIFQELIPSSTERIDHLAQSVHLLQLFHKKFVFNKEYPKSSHQKDSQMSWYRYYPAEELWSLGIRFKPSRSSNFSDVQFRRRWMRTGTLYIPPLRIDNTTKSLLLNLVAYEACIDASTKRVTSYVCFMDSLIDHPVDVKVLRSKGILLNTLGSDDQAAELFNEVASHLKPSPLAFLHVKWSIELEHRKPIKKWVAMWMRVYFSSPWTFIAFAAATFTIILTAIQTCIAVFQAKQC